MTLGGPPGACSPPRLRLSLIHSPKDLNSSGCWKLQVKFLFYFIFH